MAVPWLNLQAVAGIYQAFGIALTALGLAAVGDRIRRAREATSAAIARTRSGVGAWGARRREQLAIAWARLRRKPRPVKLQGLSAHATSRASGNLTVEVQRHRVDRDTISDRDWLAYLDDRLAMVIDQLDAAEKRRSEEREEFAGRLGVQRDELRAEIIRETRNGWQLVAWGLFYTFVGVVIGAFA